MVILLIVVCTLCILLFITGKRLNDLRVELASLQEKQGQIAYHQSKLSELIMKRPKAEKYLEIEAKFQKATQIINEMVWADYPYFDKWGYDNPALGNSIVANETCKIFVTMYSGDIVHRTVVFRNGLPIRLDKILYGNRYVDKSAYQVIMERETEARVKDAQARVKEAEAHVKEAETHLVEAEGQLKEARARTDEQVTEVMKVAEKEIAEDVAVIQPELCNEDGPKAHRCEDVTSMEEIEPDLKPQESENEEIILPRERHIQEEQAASPEDRWYAEHQEVILALRDKAIEESVGSFLIPNSMLPEDPTLTQSIMNAFGVDWGYAGASKTDEGILLDY